MKKIIVLLLVLVSIPVFGGVLKGKVVDEDGNPIAFAAISVDWETRREKQAVSDFDGNYRIWLSRGKHEIEVSFVGYEKVKEVIMVKSWTRRDFVLKLWRPGESGQLYFDGYWNMYQDRLLQAYDEEKLATEVLGVLTGAVLISQNC